MTIFTICQLFPGNEYKWNFDSSNPTSNVVWLAFHDHVQTSSHVGQAWNPELMAGNQPTSRDQDEFWYRDSNGIVSLILDDSGAYCHTTLSIGNIDGHIGVDKLDDNGCSHNQPTYSLSLYFNE